MHSLHYLDLIAIGLYFVALLWLGLHIARSQKKHGESESFMAADRDMNLFQTTATTAATDIGGGFSIAMGGLGFTLGISGSWLIAISGLSVILASFLMVPKVKRWADHVKGLTTGDLFEARFDRRTGTLAALVIGLAWFTFVGGQIIAGGKLLQVTMGMDLLLAIAVAGFIILAYTAMGGLKAVIYTDVLQMVILLVGVVFILVPIGLMQVGGWSGIVETLSASPETASMVEWDAIDWKQALGWFFSIIPIWFISIAALQRIVAARDEKTARRAFLLTGVPIEWPLFAIGSTLVGMFARILTPELSDPELATPTMILTLLPAGVTGIVIAAYIAAVMSSADSCLIGPVAIFTNDIRLAPPVCFSRCSACCSGGARPRPAHSGACCSVDPAPLSGLWPENPGASLRLMPAGWWRCRYWSLSRCLPATARKKISTCFSTGTNRGQSDDSEPAL